LIVTIVVNVRLRLDQRAPKGHAPRPECEAPHAGHGRHRPRQLHRIRPDQNARREVRFTGDSLRLFPAPSPRRAPASIRSGVHGNYFGNCKLNRGATAEGCRHAPSDISKRRPLQTLRFGWRALVNRSGHRNGCGRPTCWFRLRHRDPVGSLGARRTQTSRFANGPSMTLGRPLVSPGFAGCHVPADRRQRMGESRILQSAA
jgi:hypothetical protein